MEGYIETIMLELHIWGPGLGLPSIDAECLAAIHYLHHTVPTESWVLVPSSDPYGNPFQKLPALRNEKNWIAGFENIIQYLSNLSNGAWNIDRELDETQTADRDAYTAFLYSKGLPLLDLSLYVSSENYTGYTRSALSQLLSWPQSWTLPHELREQAKKRSEHLGLNALDVDAAREEQKEDTGLVAHIPKSLRKPRQTVSGMLGRSTQKTKFRLDAAVDEFLEPLLSKLSGKDWLIAEQMSSTDCLAVSILSLMQKPVLPQSWLQEALVNKYPTINKWTRLQADAIYDNTVSVSSILSGEQPRSGLPWQVPTPSSWTEVAAVAIEGIVSNVPLLGSGYKCYQAPQQETSINDKGDQRQLVYTRLRNQQRVFSQVVTACIGATSLLGWMIHAGLVSAPRLQRPGPVRRNFGEAGAILGL